jgi:hypothetical protein
MRAHGELAGEEKEGEGEEGEGVVAGVQLGRGRGRHGGCRRGGLPLLLLRAEREKQEAGWRKEKGEEKEKEGKEKKKIWKIFQT